MNKSHSKTHIKEGIYLAPEEISEVFIHSSGPGGQNVNKVSTAVQLRFNARKSKAISNTVYLRLKSLAGRRMTSKGIIIIEAKKFRNQRRNREDALTRLIKIIKKAMTPPIERKKTKPSFSAREKRIASKHHRARTKRNRGLVDHYD